MIVIKAQLTFKNLCVSNKSYKFLDVMSVEVPNYS